MYASRCLFLKIRKFNQNVKVNFSRVIHSNIFTERGYEIIPVADAYNPSTVEAGQYAIWEKEGRFVTKAPTSECLSLVLPPPNVTGSLHLGHALTTTLQDVLSRWMRMRGKTVAWLPGTDHAGIATQAIVEKHLFKKGITRQSLGREKFEQEVLKWKEKNGGRIQEQLRRLGASLDWTREVFTMDEKRTKAVNFAFIQLFKEGLIYRGDRLVNWSCELRSSISDIEVDLLSISDPTEIRIPGYSELIKFGLITEFAYKLKNSEEEIVVATTRPETMLGDVAVAVNPSDERYSQFIGCHVVHPFTKADIPVIADSSVDKEFGTGALKITPAHDRNDYEIAKRHNLKFISVINEAGCMEGDFPKFSGLKRYKARDVMLKELDMKGLLRNIKPHSMVLPICSRSGDVIELLPRSQWYVNCKEMAAKALESVRSGDLKIIPEHFENNWNRWLEEERDWCISRQLWWGHQIPAYKCYLQDEPEKFIWVAAENKELASKEATASLNSVDIVCERDTDVLDTWFSSGLYPFSLLGWPKKTNDLEKLYPLHIMVTGHDILCFWVCRMVMLGTKLTGKLPFGKVLLHGVICDSSGAKMSKSKGNVIDPEDVISGISLEDLNSKTYKSFQDGALSEDEMNKAIERQKKLYPSGIPACGADALRFSLCSKNITNHYIQFDLEDCHADKLFCNKIWQSLKYFRNVFEACNAHGLLYQCKKSDLDVVDRWILSRMCCLVQTVNENLEEYNFHIATAAIKRFLYDEICDFYIECTKDTLKGDINKNATKLGAHCHTFAVCFNTALRCLAPFMPFLVEELIPVIPLNHNCIYVYRDGYNNLSFPDVKHFQTWRDTNLESRMESTMNIISTVRNMKSTYKIANNLNFNLWIECKNDYIADVIFENRDIISLLTKSSKVLTKENDKNVSEIWSFSDKNNCKVFLELPQATDSSQLLEIGKEKLLKKKEKLTKNLEKLQAVIVTDGYREKATREVQMLHANKIKALKEDLAKLERFDDHN